MTPLTMETNENERSSTFTNYVLPYCFFFNFCFIPGINLQVKKNTVQSQEQPGDFCPVDTGSLGGNQWKASTVIQQNTECYQVARGPTQEIHQ